MQSGVFSDSQRQLTLTLDESALSHHRTVRDVVAQGVYKLGLKRVAAELDVSPGNLSVALSDDPARKFSVDEMERYVQATGDKTPIYWLVHRYLGDETASRDHWLAQVKDLIEKLPALMGAAGLPTATRRGAR